MPRKPVQSARAARTARDNARAKALGYKSYYDWRAHDSGRIPPGKPRLRGDQLAKARGHRSAADLERALKEGSLVSVLATKRDDKTGRLLRVEIQAIDPDGSERTYILEGRTLTQKRLDQLSGQIDRGGGIVSPLYPIRGIGKAT